MNKTNVKHSVSFTFRGVPITVKEMLVKGKTVERYFIYHAGFNGTAGGHGYKDIVSLYSRFRYHTKRQDAHFNDLITEFRKAGLEV